LIETTTKHVLDGSGKIQNAEFLSIILRIFMVQSKQLVKTFRTEELPRARPYACLQQSTFSRLKTHVSRLEKVLRADR